MERRSDCTEVAKNVLFTGGIKKLTLESSFSSQNVITRSVCSLSHLNMGGGGNKSVSRLKRGNG